MADIIKYAKGRSSITDESCSQLSGVRQPKENTGLAVIPMQNE